MLWLLLKTAKALSSPLPRAAAPALRDRHCNEQTGEKSWLYRECCYSLHWHWKPLRCPWPRWMPWSTASWKQSIPILLRIAPQRSLPPITSEKNNKKEEWIKTATAAKLDCDAFHTLFSSVHICWGSSYCCSSGSSPPASTAIKVVAPRCWVGKSFNIPKSAVSITWTYH